MAINVPSAARELGPLWELQLKQLAQKGQRWNQVADTIRGFGDIADAYQKSKDNKLTLEEKKGRIAEAKDKRKRAESARKSFEGLTIDIPDSSSVTSDVGPIQPGTGKRTVPLLAVMDSPEAMRSLSESLKTVREYEQFNVLGSMTTLVESLSKGQDAASLYEAVVQDAESRVWDRRNTRRGAKR